MLGQTLLPFLVKWLISLDISGNDVTAIGYRFVVTPLYDSKCLEHFAYSNNSLKPAQESLRFDVETDTDDVVAAVDAGELQQFVGLEGLPLKEFELGDSKEFDYLLDYEVLSEWAKKEVKPGLCVRVGDTWREI